MDYDQKGDFQGSSDQNVPEPTHQRHDIPPAIPSPQAFVDSKPKKRRGWGIFWGIILGMSILANIGMFLVLITMAVAFAAGSGGVFNEEIVQEGPRSAKIAVINLQGIIDDRQADEVYKQLKRARKDDNVKGLILRINSPGGTISGSDRIYHEISKKTDKPVVAFMQSVAASGGYYAAVACDKIVAEPTTITGSIGVIAGYLVLDELLRGKLGIKPVIVKSGPKKDWPSSFRDPNTEELEYLKKKLIEPAYARFLDVIFEGRSDVLSKEQIRELADGSIYGAEEAKEKKLIDSVGYMEEAVDQVMALAGLKKAQVVEYRKPFSMVDFLASESRSRLRFDRRTLYELGTPQLMYLWLLQ